MNTKINEILADHQTGMSKFQDDHLVTVRAGGTIYGQYKQSLREVYKRIRGVRELSCDMEKLQVEIDEQLFISENETDPFKKRYAEIEYRRKLMQTEESQRVFADTTRELNNFYSQAAYFKEQIGELTPEKREKLDKEMWSFKVREMATIDFITTGRLSNNTYEFLNSLPTDMKVLALGDMKQPDKMIEHYENREDILIPSDIPQLILDIPTFKQLSAGIDIEEKQI